MRTDDGDLTAPDQKCSGRVQHALHIRVEGRLVDDDMPLQAADVRWPAGQGAHLKAACKPDAVRRDVLGLATFVLVFEKELLHARDTLALGPRNHAGELGAVADRLQALFLGVADVVDVVTACRLSRRSHQRLVQHGAEGNAGAPALRDGDDRRLKRGDLALVQHQNAVRQRIEVVRDRAHAGGQVVPFQDTEGRSQWLNDGRHHDSPRAKE